MRIFFFLSQKNELSKMKKNEQMPKERVGGGQTGQAEYIWKP